MRRAVVAAVVILGLVGCGFDRAEDAATMVPPTTLGPPDPDAGVNKYPLGEGPHTIATDPGWVYFRTPSGRGCAIGPIGQVAACDFAPADAPPGSNQTIIDGDVPAAYRRVSSPTFTRDVAVLPEGHRLTNGGTRCAVGRSGEVRCETVGGSHGFVIDAAKGSLW